MSFRFRTVAVTLAIGLVSTTAGAQTAPAPNLADFVTDPQTGATQLQREAGVAVQRMCGALAAAGGFSLNDPEQQELFLRCNELVQTAQELQGSPDTTRSLGLGSGELLAAVQQISGEELHSQSTLSTRVTNGQFSNIAGRLNSLRLGGAGVAGGGAVAFSGPQDTDREFGAGLEHLSVSGGAVRGGGAASEVEGSRLGWFLDGTFNTGDRDQSANEDGFDFDATSFTVGLDYMFDSGVIGISAGLDNYDADFDDALLVSGGNVEVEGTTGSLFGAWYGGNFYLDGIVSFGDLDSDISRRAVYQSNNDDPNCQCPDQSRTLTGETGGDFVAAGFTVGYDVNRGNWDLATTLSLAYRDIDIDGYDEVDSLPNGGLALRYESHKIESLRSILGLAVTRNISREFGVLSPLFRVEWHHEFEDDPLTVAAKYIAEDDLAAGSAPDDFTPACISCFRFSTDEIDSDFALVGVGVSMVFAGRLQLYGAYDALLGLENLSSNSISLGIRGQF